MRQTSWRWLVPFILVLQTRSDCHGFTTSTPRRSTNPTNRIAAISPPRIRKSLTLFVGTSDSETGNPETSQKLDATTTPATSPPNNVDNINNSNLPRQRSIGSVERFARLPVWPAWNGVLLFIVSKLLGPTIAAQLEDKIGGRVCPNFYVPEKTSPFIMLVHHRHSFAAWDPLRYIQRTFFPEGFPAHPHRGFITVTYFLRGGFLHRDSLGIKQTYGAEDRHNGKHTQYLMTGSGMLHEEMWNIESDNWMGVSGQELYQLWLNVPAANKLNKPFVQLLGGPDETPLVVNDDKNVETLVLAGEYQGQSSNAKVFSEVSIFHVKLNQPSSKWVYDIPSSHETALFYIRTGSIILDGETIGPHNTVYLTSAGQQVVLQAKDSADILFLSGAPLYEPVAAQGSMVMNSGMEIQQAYQDYNAGNMGVPWDHKLSDQEWQNHVARYPSRYK